MGVAGINKLVEKQMRNWEIARRQGTEVEETCAETPVADFVTISRAVGTVGAQVAEQVAQRLGWPLFDKEILRYMAENDQVRARLYERMNQRDTSWLESMMRNLLQGDYRKEDYFYRLSETVLTVARQGPAVFLGRGADLVLPRERGLRVRFIAPLEVRIAAYADEHGCSPEAARIEIARIEHEREVLFSRQFGHRKADPTRFDLLINLGQISHGESVEIILTCLQQRGVR